MINHLFVATAHGVISFERDEAEWLETAQGLSEQQATCAAARAGTVLAGTTDGIFRSTDFGQSWQPANEGLDIRHVRWLAYHLDQSGLAFAGTEPAGIFVSEDNGESWQDRPEVAELRQEHQWYLPYSPEAGCVRGFAFKGSRGYATVEQGGLLRSDDSGETWALVGGSDGDPNTATAATALHPDVHSVAVHPSSAELVFAATGGGLYRSGDGGQSWQRLYDCYCRAVWPDPTEPDHLIFGPADRVDRNGRIEETVDGGQSWQLASKNLPEVPWSEHMVERLVEVNERLMAVLSNGQLLATPAVALVWRHALPNLTDIKAVSPMIE